MAVLQLLLHRNATGTVALEAVDNPDSLAPSAFETNDTAIKAFRVGTQGLLEAAAGLKSAGFVVQSVDFRDEFGQVWPNMEWQHQLVRNLRAGRLNEVLSYLDGPGNDVYVYGVELFDSESGSAVNLRQDGVVVLFGSAQRDRLVNALAGAWHNRWKPGRP
jgi:hypothetical protein